METPMPCEKCGAPAVTIGATFLFFDYVVIYTADRVSPLCASCLEQERKDIRQFVRDHPDAAMLQSGLLRALDSPLASDAVRSHALDLLAEIDEMPDVDSNGSETLH